MVDKGEAIEKTEKAIADMVAAKNFVPRQGQQPGSGQLGLHALIEEIEHLAVMLDNKVKDVKQRLAEFNSLQNRFYNGR